MSVTIYWRPTSKKDRHFRSGTSTSLNKLKSAFGDHIGPENVNALRAMALASDDAFYDEVADTVEANGTIYIYGEY